jgi:hypothetical protein
MTPFELSAIRSLASKLPSIGAAFEFLFLLRIKHRGDEPLSEDTPKFDCARLAPSVQRGAREMSTLLPDIERTDVETALKGKASGELARTIIVYTQARQALLKPLKDYRDSLEELAHLLQRCAR